MKLSIIVTINKLFAKDMRLQLTASSLLLLSIILQFSCNSVSAYKYLAVLPTYARSHFSVGSSLMKALAEKGHEVYVISPYPQKHPIENYHDIPLTTVGEAMEGE